MVTRVHWMCQRFVTKPVSIYLVSTISKKLLYHFDSSNSNSNRSNQPTAYLHHNVCIPHSNFHASDLSVDSRAGNGVGGWLFARVLAFDTCISNFGCDWYLRWGSKCWSWCLAGLGCMHQEEIQVVLGFRCRLGSWFERRRCRTEHHWCCWRCASQCVQIWASTLRLGEQMEVGRSIEWRYHPTSCQLSWCLSHPSPRYGTS